MVWRGGDHLIWGVTGNADLKRRFEHADACRVYLEEKVEDAGTAAKKAKTEIRKMKPKGCNVGKLVGISLHVDAVLRATGEDFDSDEEAIFGNR